MHREKTSQRNHDQAYGARGFHLSSSLTQGKNQRLGEISRMNLKKILSFTAVALPLAVSMPQLALADGGHTLFISIEVENANGTGTFPLHRRTSHRQTQYYVMTSA